MSLYEELGVGQGADTREIKKAYFDLARIHHPDKGGDPEKFKKIENAYSILSDDEKRKVYDMTGSTEPGASMPMFNFGFMGGMPGMGGESGLPKMPSIGGATGPSMLLLMNLNDVDLSNLIVIHRPNDRDEYFHY